MRKIIFPVLISCILFVSHVHNIAFPTRRDSDQGLNVQQVIASESIEPKEETLVTSSSDLHSMADFTRPYNPLNPDDHLAYGSSYGSNYGSITPPYSAQHEKSNLNPALSYGTNYDRPLIPKNQPLYVATPCRDLGKSSVD